jgi:hypothetical protein
MLRWLGQRVGPSGLAVGVDKNTTYLHDFVSTPFQIYKGTFLEVELSHSFDLIHGRYVLIHNQTDMDILHKIKYSRFSKREDGPCLKSRTLLQRPYPTMGEIALKRG